MSYFYTQFCGNTVHVLDVKACLSSTVLKSGLDVIFMLSTNGSNNSAIRQLTAKRCRNFLGTVLTGLLKVTPPAVMQTLWLHHLGAPARLGEVYLQRLIAICLGRWIGRGGSFERPFFRI
jgi:hypothetical protein